MYLRYLTISLTQFGCDNRMEKDLPMSEKFYIDFQIFHIKTSRNCLLIRLERLSLHILRFYYHDIFNWRMYFNMIKGYRVNESYSKDNCHRTEYKNMFARIWKMCPFVFYETFKSFQSNSSYTFGNFTSTILTSQNK